jgi:hypothetical protein
LSEENAMKAVHDRARELRRFGLMVGGIFGALGLWPLVVHGQPARVWALALGVALVGPALMWPRALEPVQQGWMRLGEVLGWINTRIVLGVIFYGLLTPMGLGMRVMGRDPMRRRAQAGVDTYRIAATPRPGSHMTRQF